ANSKIFRVLKNKYFLVTLFFVVWVVFFDSNNLINWYADIRTVISQDKQKTYYKESILQADEKLKELSSNMDSLEKFAREQYLFHEQDEELFIMNK
ncbi:MAG: septum formation inhibitor, partial [Bacteroidales bacterium]